MDNVKISVVIPCMNAEKTIRRCIESIVSQNYRNFELLVIDGGSKDNTKKIIECYKDQITYFVSEPDKGTSDAMNKGAEKAKGDLITFLNADDMFYSQDTLKKVADYYNNSGRPDFIMSAIEEYDPEGLVDTYTYLSNPSGIKRRMTVCIPGAFFKRDLFRERKFLDKYDYANDYEFFLYLFFRKKASYKVLDLITVKFSYGGRSTLGKNSWIMFKEICLMKKEHLGWPSFLGHVVLEGPIAILRQSGIRPKTWWRKIKKSGFKSA